MPTDVIIDLRSVQHATLLFSYPNTGHADQTLEQTIEHYLTDSLTREGLVNFQVVAGADGAGYKANLTLADVSTADQVRARYQAFFNLGTVGLQDLDTFKQGGTWDPSWEFLMPLGLPIAFAFAVELMDFPPLTLISNQDYLKSKTTSRWWELLVANGVSDDQKARYSCILDIVPVAAPASDGTNLDQAGIYNGPFDTYSLGLLDVLVKSQTPGEQRPLMALGMPIRTWIQRLWNLAINVGDVGTLKLDTGVTCSVMGSNHPSFFYYAVHSAKGAGAAAKNLAAGLAVMKQDVVASAWQAAMGANPAGDRTATLAACNARWANRDDEILQMVKDQSGIAVPATLALSLEDVRPHLPPPPNLRLLEREFYQSGRKALPKEFW